MGKPKKKLKGRRKRVRFIFMFALSQSPRTRSLEQTTGFLTQLTDIFFQGNRGKRGPEGEKGEEVCTLFGGIYTYKTQNNFNPLENLT